MKNILPKTFFDRDPDIVARELIGKVLVWKGDRFEITETESYHGEEDSASHARHGKEGRAGIMFGKPGIIYAYLIYGMYDMLNIVTGRKDDPGAVLIRGVQDLDGEEKYDGPGKLTKALGITRELNGKKLGKESGLWIEKSGQRHIEIEAVPRVGIGYADKGDREAKRRFKKVVHN